MKTKVPVFVKGASNVYRTKEFIVNQRLAIDEDTFETNVLVSRDTYYKRTTMRDIEYERYFSRRKHIDGKRLPSGMYVRTYIY